MTKKVLSINVFDIAGGPFAVSSLDGEVLYKRIYTILKNDGSVSLSFNNITVLTAAFLNSAIGQLYGQFEEEFINSKLNIVDMEQDDRNLLNVVIRTAKQYFRDPERFNEIVASIPD